MGQRHANYSNWRFLSVIVYRYRDPIVLYTRLHHNAVNSACLYIR